ncbi:MAG: PIN domain-containing protein [Slackia sp.]|nr:PIN domain-containing protein [Slackia sp.]
MELMCDNNVFLDYVLDREPFARDAEKLLAAAAFGDVNLTITTAMTTDLFYILSKSYGAQEAQRRIADMLEFIGLCGVSSNTARTALEKRWSDFEDCLVSCCAEEIDADYIVTRNGKDFSQSKVPAVSPSFILEELEKRGLSYDRIEL